MAGSENLKSDNNIKGSGWIRKEQESVRNKISVYADLNELQEPGFRDLARP